MATHLVTLHTANLIVLDTHLKLHPTVADWLTFSPAEQAAHITRALTSTGKTNNWMTATAALRSGLDETNYTETIRQWTKQTRHAKKRVEPAEWREQHEHSVQITLILPQNPPATSATPTAVSASTASNR